MFVLVVWFTPCPVGCFYCQSLVGPDPCPGVIDLADPNPVVGVFLGQPFNEMPDLPLVLDGHHVCVVLPAPVSSFIPNHLFVRVVVGPALYTSPHAQHWMEDRDTY